jgi:hypothetical protein
MDLLSSRGGEVGKAVAVRQGDSNKPEGKIFLSLPVQLDSKDNMEAL